MTDEIATMRSRHLDALHQQRAWVHHWIDDVAAGLTPTPESLSKALAGIDAAIAVTEAKRGALHAAAGHIVGLQDEHGITDRGREVLQQIDAALGLQGGKEPTA